MEVLSDVAAERAVLAGIYKFGNDAYLDVVDMIDEQTFTANTTTTLFKCFQNVFKNDENASLDLASIHSAANEIGLSSLLAKPSEMGKIHEILSLSIQLQNVRKFAGKIRKLQVARLLNSHLEAAKNQVLGIEGHEPISEILGMVEDTVFNFTSLLHDSDSGTIQLSSKISDHVEDLIKNPVDQIGISTGFPIWDVAVGGGLRRGTVNIFGARTGVGKTLLVNNMAWNIAGDGIPVLNFDTEMNAEDQINRSLAMKAQVALKDIETGKFSKSADHVSKVRKAAEDMKDQPYHYKSIAGMAFEEQLAVMRRWVIKEVGLHPDKTAKECVIFYDYLKLMDSKGMSSSMQEYQLLGFMMTSLHNFAVRYKVPIVLTIQLNRDGITKESSAEVSGSDRVVWLCSNLTYFKPKSDEELAEDSANNGSHKLIPIKARHGPCLQFGDYINCHLRGHFAQIEEGKTKLESNKNQEFEIEDGNDIPF